MSVEVCKVDFLKLSSVNCIFTSLALTSNSKYFKSFLEITNYPGHYVLVRFAVRKATHTLSFYL